LIRFVIWSQIFEKIYSFHIYSLWLDVVGKYIFLEAERQ
jgi:hypothetical protein